MTSMLSTKRISKSLYIGTFLVITIAFIFIGSNLNVTEIHAASAYGSPTDPNIKYTGRWDIGSSTIHTSYWPGAYLTTDFTGRTVKIKLAGSANIYITIDNGKDIYYPAAKGTVNLTPTPLATGTHSLRVAAYSEHDDIQFQGLILDSGARTVAPPTSPQLIEFVGDSITAGAKTTKHALSDYAWLTGERLSVAHTQIAQGGSCLVDGIQCGSPNAIGMSKQFFKLQTVYFPNSPNWDFSRYQANEVVINLGTNDNGYHDNDATFQSTYITFLQNIRKQYPHARIFVLRPFKGAKAAYALAAVRAVNAAGDKNVGYVDTTGWITDADTADGTHPTDAGHVKIANKLGPILAHYLGLAWKSL